MRARADDCMLDFAAVRASVRDPFGYVVAGAMIRSIANETAFAETAMADLHDVLLERRFNEHPFSGATDVIG